MDKIDCFPIGLFQMFKKVLTALYGVEFTPISFGYQVFEHAVSLGRTLDCYHYAIAYILLLEKHAKTAKNALDYQPHWAF